MPAVCLNLPIVEVGLFLWELKRVVKGGEGSGNFGHEGRPGEVGGSGEGGVNRFDDTEKWERSLMTKQQRAINSWMHTGYVEMRNDDKNDENNAKLNNLKESLKTAPLYEGTVYRGIRIDIKADVGDTIKLESISSFTTDISVAKHFALQGEIKMVSILSVSKHSGFEMLPQVKLGTAGNESEVIGLKGRSFKVTSVVEQNFVQPMNGLSYPVRNYQLEEVQ